MATNKCKCTWANTKKTSSTFYKKNADHFHYTIYSHISRKYINKKSNSITNNLAKLVADPKVTLASDQIYLPRITENGVPVYETLGRFSHTLRVLNKLFVALPVLAVTNASMPFIMLTGIALHYFLYFKVILFVIIGFVWIGYLKTCHQNGTFT